MNDNWNQIETEHSDLNLKLLAQEGNSPKNYYGSLADKRFYLQISESDDTATLYVGEYDPEAEQARREAEIVTQKARLELTRQKVSQRETTTTSAVIDKALLDMLTLKPLPTPNDPKYIPAKSKTAQTRVSQHPSLNATFDYLLEHLN